MLFINFDFASTTVFLGSLSVLVRTALTLGPSACERPSKHSGAVSPNLFGLWAGIYFELLHNT